MSRKTRMALAVFAAFAVLAGATGAGAGAGTARAKPKKHKHKPKPKPCKLFTHDQIDNAVSPDADLVSLQKARASGIYGSLIPKGTNCGYLWDTSVQYPAPGNPSGSCDPDSLGLYSDYSPGYGWIVSYGYSSRQWNKLKKSQTSSPRAPDPNGLNGQTAHNISLGHHSKAFYIEDDAYCSAATPALFAYTLYVRTRHHNLLAIFLWPSQLGQTTSLAASALAPPHSL